MIENLEDLRKNQEEQLAKGLEMLMKTVGLDMSDYQFIKVKSQPKAAPNIQVFQSAAYLSATCLKPASNKILMYFFSFTEFENFIGMDIKTISDDLEMTERTVITAINELTDNGIIIKIQSPSDKRRHDYYLNPMSAWKGKTLNRKMVLARIQSENPNQLHLFGETLEENQIREAEEIRKKRPNLFLQKRGVDEYSKNHAIQANTEETIE